MAWIVWNLFLASLPLALAGPLARRIAKAPGRRSAVLSALGLGAAWLLLLPNAPYLLTEIRHLLLDDRWRELTGRARHDPGALREATAAGALFLLYGVAGLVLFVAAVRPVEAALAAAGLSRPVFRAFLHPLMAVGVWLGLIPRFNSWDALLRPTEVVATALGAIGRPVTLAALLAFAAVLAGLHALAEAAWERLVARSGESIGPST